MGDASAERKARLAADDDELPATAVRDADLAPHVQAHLGEAHGHAAPPAEAGDAQPLAGLGEGERERAAGAGADVGVGRCGDGVVIDGWRHRTTVPFGASRAIVVMVGVRPMGTAGVRPIRWSLRAAPIAPLNPDLDTKDRCGEARAPGTFGPPRWATPVRCRGDDESRCTLEGERCSFPYSRDPLVLPSARCALLDQKLRDVDLSFAQWTVLAFTGAGSATSDDIVERQLADRVVSDAASGRESIDALVRAGLVTVGSGGDLVQSTEGKAVVARLDGEVDAITQRLYGDVSIDDLEATHRTLPGHGGTGESAVCCG